MTTTKNLILYTLCAVLYCTALSTIDTIELWISTGSAATMQCPPYNTSYLVQRNGCFMHIDPLIQRRIQSSQNNITQIIDLHISNVSTNDEGSYWCECSGNLYQYVMKLKGQPRFLHKDEDNTILGTEGYNLTVTCVLEIGSPPEQLLIKRKGIVAASGGPISLNYTLLLDRKDHWTEYICLANSSKFGTPLVDRFTLYIGNIPDPPINVSSKTCTCNTSIFVSWITGASLNLKQMFYIEHKVEKSKRWKRIGPMKQERTNTMTYYITNVSFDAIYEIRIFAENDLGRSIYSSVVRTTAFVVKPTDENSSTSIHVAPLQYWLILGIISGSLIIICILSHVCRQCGKRTSLGTTNALLIESHYEEIDIVQYLSNSVAPVVPASMQDNDQINPSANEMETEGDLPGSLDNTEANQMLHINRYVQPSFQQQSEQAVHSRNLHSPYADDNSEAESDIHFPEEHTVNTEDYENPYTPLKQNVQDGHHYSICRTPIVLQGQSSQTLVDNDYINLIL